ncbi:meiosis-specific nuclear structural protein 1-like [Chrysoperla carnea]|uniref:meiosis-specific nuclear structural protein 1-like n=1 Tax=Chrysoperla carnea TaxID=189513 RepID=UPI001D0693C7|nr:meiosis-specific nuclear structural protein 1-like [Chrysoperla carnea]
MSKVQGGMERKLAAQLREEQLNQNLINTSRLQMIENERADLTKRSNSRKVIQHIFIEQKEMDLLKQMQKDREKEKIGSDRSHFTDEKLAQQMDLVKREEIVELKRRQQLRENDPELRELERKLRLAYAAKELACQIAQKKAEELEQKVREQQANEAFNKLRANDSEFDKQQCIENEMKKADYRHSLQNQMLVRERQKQIDYENYLTEKKIIDDVVQRIRDEDESAANKRLQDMKKVQEEMKQHEAAREAWRQKEIERIKAENDRIERYLNEQMESKKKSDDEKKLKEAARERLIQEIGKQIHSRDEEREERNMLLLELMEEEAKEADIKRAQAEMEKKYLTRLQLSYALDLQIKEKEDRLKQECENDYKYRQELMERLIEEERIHQMTEQKRRRKMIEVRHTVEKMMLERQEKRAAEIQQLWRLKELEKENENKRKEKIDFERIQLLKEHAKNLVGFLPSGLLKEEDLKYLDEDVAKQLKETLSLKEPC